MSYRVRLKKVKLWWMGASVGAINMSSKWLCSKNFGYYVKESSIYEGIGLDNISVLSHYDLENNFSFVRRELSPLSEEINIYAANKDCVIRIKGDKIDILGNV